MISYKIPDIRNSLIIIISFIFFSNASVLADGLKKVNGANSIPGAYADGIHKDTKAIQAAIDSIASLGGGVVLLSNGHYLSGPLTLKSNITFTVDSTAVLLASQNVKDYYPSGADTTKPASSLVNFISSKKANNVTITGYGTIDGQGQPWWDAENAAKAHGTDTLRPRLIQLESGSHIKVTNITLKNAPMFHLCPNSSYDVFIDSVKIYAPSTAPNTDGIDPGKCHHVRISNCIIDNGDDNIAVGASSADASWPNAASSDIIIKHCTFLHGHGCSIGSLTSGGVDSLLVDSCTFANTDNGIRIKSSRSSGGNVRNLTYSNLTMTNVRYPIYLSEYYPKIPAQTDTAQLVTSLTPHFHDISFNNISSTNSASNSTAGVVVGLPEMKINNVHFSNISISAKTGLQVRNATVDTLNTIIKVTSGTPYSIEINGIVIPKTSTGVIENNTRTSGYQLLQNYPNPFNPSTTIQYQVPTANKVTLKVYDILGKEVLTLVNEFKAAGKYQITFDCSKFASGVYFYKLEAGSSVQFRKMVFAK